MKFVWDEAKDLVNFRKHKVRFVQAVHAFSDPLREEYYDGKGVCAFQADTFFHIAALRKTILLWSAADLRSAWL